MKKVFDGFIFDTIAFDPCNGGPIDDVSSFDDVGILEENLVLTFDGTDRMGCPIRTYKDKESGAEVTLSDSSFYED